MAFVAIEFEEEQLLVAIAQKSGLRSRVSKVLVVDVNGDDDETVGQRLKEQLSSFNAVKADLVAIVSRSLAEIRELTVPPAPDGELPEMIRFQARNEFASLNDQWKLDYVPLSHDPEAPRRVLAAAINPQLESRIATISQHAGLRLKRIVLRPFATLDLLKVKFSENDSLLIVDQNLDSTDMSIVQKGELVSTRTVRLPRTLSADQRAKQLVTEVRRTLASHKLSSGGEAIESVAVSGEEARYRHLKGDLEGKLGLSVSFVDPLSLMDVATDAAGNSSSNRTAQDDDQESGEVDRARLTSLFGALKSEIDGKSPQLDFANVRKTEIIKADYSKLYFYAGLFALVGFVGLLSAWLTLRSQSLQIEIAKANVVDAIKINQGDGRFPSVDQQLNEVRLLDQWKIDDVNWLTELSDFSGRYLLPDDVIADSFTASVQRDGTPKIVLRGRIVEDLAKTDQLIKALSQRPYEVEPIDTGTIAPDQKSDYPSTFEYHLRLPETVKLDLNKLNRRAIAFGRVESPKGANSSEGSQP